MSHKTVQEIKSKIDIIDVLGALMPLKRRGKNFIGLCPFHNEKTPSFYVSPHKEIYKCFGCSKSGNAITFLMEHEKLSYIESLKWLANRYHIEIIEVEPTDEERQISLISDSLVIVNQFASNFYQEHLQKNQEINGVAWQYLHEQRGFTADTISKFLLGFHPNERGDLSLHEKLWQQQFNKDISCKTGLVKKSDNGYYYDVYTGRVIFPIQHHLNGKIIGFGARVIGTPDKSISKYLNTPENEIFSKREILYGLYFAKQPISQANECLLVEGYTDVIGLHQSGITNVVSSSGTSLTKEQLKLILKYSDNLTILYDGDDAGIKAALRGLDLALAEGLHVKLVLLPEGEDPDSFVRKKGKEEMVAYIQTHKKDFIFFQAEFLMKQAGDDIIKKNEAVNIMAQTISGIHQIEKLFLKQEYIRKCATLLNMPEQGFIELVNTYAKKNIKATYNNYPKTITPPDTSEKNEQLEDDTDSLIIAPVADKQYQERQLIKIILLYGNEPWVDNQIVVDHILLVIIEFPFVENSINYRIIEAIKAEYDNYQSINSKNYIYHDDLAIRTLIAEILTEPYQLSQGWFENKKTSSFKSTNNKNQPSNLKMQSGDEDSLPDDPLQDVQDYRIEVSNSLCYYKITKIKEMIEANRLQLQKPLNSEDDIALCFQIHLGLKEREIQIAKELGTVIIK
ncbi:MAG: DNA primase [Phycisphaerales bacterium]|nr:DNA primase [Phycisphaerales bacterium]